MINHRSEPVAPPPPLKRWALAAYSVALAYGGGLWLHLLHEAEGSTELNAPPSVLHWLRDSSLALPLIVLGVWMGATVGRRLLERYGKGAPRQIVVAVIPTIVALYASIVVSAGNPVHGLLFVEEHGAHELPFALHLLRDGLVALTGNLLVAGLLALVLATRRQLAGAFAMSGKFALRAGFSLFMVASATLGAVAPAAEPVAAASTGPCPTTAPIKSFDVQAIDVTMPLNRHGDHDPLAHMYVLSSMVSAVRAQEAAFNNPLTQADSISIGLNGFPVKNADGSISVVEDAIQPLAIRANQGDCVQIHFTNNASAGPVGMHIDGVVFNMDSSGDFVGNNTQTSVVQGASATYTYFVPDLADLEGSHYIHPGPGARAAVNHGLFGTLTVEPRGSTYVHPDGTPIPDPTLDSGWERTIVPGANSAAADANGVLGCQPRSAGACPAFRENIKVLHDIGNESEPIMNKGGSPLPNNDPHTHAYRPGSRGINYRSEPFMDRLDLNPDQKSQTYGSYTFSDTSDIIPRGYQGDPTKFRLIHGGSEVFHVYHLHGGAIRWRFNPRADLTFDYGKTGLDKHPQVQNAESWQLDAQSTGPGEGYNLEIEGGAGSNQSGAGEFLFHCHIAHHYFSGMWGYWRVFDTLQPNFAPLPRNADGTTPNAFTTDPDPALGAPAAVKVKSAVTSDKLIGTTFNGQTINTPQDLDDWIRPQLPAQGVKQRDPVTGFSQDGSVFDWTTDGNVYLGEHEAKTSWPDLPRLADGPLGTSPTNIEVGHPGSLIVDQFPSTTNPDRPAILFNPNNGRPAFPLLRAHPGDRPPLAPNGHSGAPYLGEMANEPVGQATLRSSGTLRAGAAVDPYANRADSICPTEASHGVNGAQIRTNNIVAVPMPIQNTAAGVTDLSGGLFVLAQNKLAVENGTPGPDGQPAWPKEPLALRANIGDCVFNTLTSEEADGNPELPFAKANIHIHHVQFDTQSSDGVISGFSFDQSVRPYKIEDTTLTQAANAGDTVLHVASVAKFLNPDGSQRKYQAIAIGEGLNNLEVRRIALNGVDATNLTLTLNQPLGVAHTLGEYTGNEFVQYIWYPDINLDNIFWHDHVNGIFGWSHGFVGQLVIEPKGATYHNPKTGAETPSGAAADIWCVSNPTDPTRDCNNGSLIPGQIDGSYREQVIWTIDDHSTVGNSINLRAEPWQDRLNKNPDPSLLFSSYTFGDPYTPVLRAYKGDQYVVRAINVSQNTNTLHFDGARFHTEVRFSGQFQSQPNQLPASPGSSQVTPTVNVRVPGLPIGTPTDTLEAGISERYTLALESDSSGRLNQVGDFLYNDGLATAFRNGAWGLVRVLDPSKGALPFLQPLPGTTLSGTQSLPAVTGGRPPANANPGDPCNGALPSKQFSVTAVALPSSAAGGGQPGRKWAFVQNNLLTAVKAGTLLPEPLVIHVAAGTCFQINMTNDSGSSLGRVSMALPRLLADAKSLGVNVGFDVEQSVTPGATRAYRFFADTDKLGTAPITGWGGQNTSNVTQADMARDGLYGAVVVMPSGSAWSNPAGFGSQGIVTRSDGSQYRDYTLLFSEQDPIIGTSHMPYPVSTSAAIVVNYRNAGVRNPGDPNMFSSTALNADDVPPVPYGDPLTPLIRGYAGDPIRIHAVGAPGMEQDHVIDLGGFSWPVDPAIAHSNNRELRMLGTYQTWDAQIEGGMGGLGHAIGDFVYQDRRLPYTEGGMWGLIRSLDPTTCVTGFRSLAGLGTCT